MQKKIIASNSGFTILELVIVLMILAFLSIMSSQSIQNAVRVKKRVQEEIDWNSQARDAMSIIERDINLAFHYRDYMREMQAQLEKEKTQNAAANPQDPNQPTPTPTPNNQTDAQKQAEQERLANISYKSKQLSDKPIVSAFLGDSDKLDFTSTSHVRSMDDTSEGNIHAVGYFLKSCKSIFTSQASQCLWRRTNVFFDQDITKDGNSTVVIENVKEFSLRYLGYRKQDWQKTWYSNERGDVTTRNNFPVAVEVTLKLAEHKKETSLTLVAPIHFPNNPTKDSAQDPANPNAPAPPAGAVR